MTAKKLTTIRKKDNRMLVKPKQLVDPDDTLIPDEIQDDREIRDPKVRAAIRKSYEEFLAGKSRPIQELFAERVTRTTRRRRRRA